LSSGLLDSRASRLLAFGGIFLIVAGMLLGDIFAVFILHPNNGRIGAAMYAAAMAIPSGDVDAIMSHFQAIGGFLENRGTKVDAHSHAVAMGYIAVLLAVLQPYVAWSGAAKLRLAWIYVVSAVALPISIFAIHYVGLAYSPLEYIGWASIAADLSALIVAIVVSIQLLGLWQYSRGPQGVDIKSTFLGNVGDSGRILLAGGSLLLLAGFLYGAGYAAYLQNFLSPGEVEILRSILANATAGQSVDADFGTYGAYLAFRGLNKAAHAHVNVMGILLLVFALVQPFVFLSERWKKRWAWTLVISSFALPVFILLEFRFGLLAGAFADISGALAMCGVAAILFGLVRRTGATDSGA
jgi:hypothetical protein